VTGFPMKHTGKENTPISDRGVIFDLPKPDSSVTPRCETREEYTPNTRGRRPLRGMIPTMPSISFAGSGVPAVVINQRQTQRPPPARDGASTYSVLSRKAVEGAYPYAKAHTRDALEIPESMNDQPSFVLRESLNAPHRSALREIGKNPVTDPRLGVRCELCKARPGDKCVNTVQPNAPLPGREFHYARVEK